MARIERGLRISVLRRFDPEEVFDELPVGHVPFGACDKFEDGQVFFIGEDFVMPEGFCGWAWDDLQKVMLSLMTGGNFPWYTEEGVAVGCCTDGLRPVVFKIERLS